MKKVRCVLTLFAVFFCGLVVAGVANATTYQEEVDIRFTFDQILNIDLSSNSLAIDNLAPGTTGTSSPIDVTVNTNNIGGYVLTASVGNTTHNTDSLTRTDGQSAVFTNIARNANLTAFSTDNTWGYSVDDGEHFFGLPLYNDSESLILKETDGATEDNTVSLLIGAKAGISQPLGDYSNVVNFKVVAKVYNPMRTFQETEYAEYATLLPYVGDTMEIMDSRDGEIYTIGRLADGNVWLLDNLRLDLTTVGGLTPDSTNLHYNWTPSYTNYTIYTANKNNSLPYGSGDVKTGIYYNFCAASAGSFCHYNDDYYSQDICPSGWRLPTGGVNGEYQALYYAYRSNVTNFKNALRTSLSGKYGYDSTLQQSSVLEQGTTGYFWASTYGGSGYNRYALKVSGSAIDTQYISDISGPVSVRCILYNGTPNERPTLQNVSDSWLAEHLRNSNSSASLEDERDGQLYHVKKMLDGHYWFIDDFKISTNGCWYTPNGGQCSDEFSSNRIYLNSTYTPFIEKGENTLTEPYWTNSPNEYKIYNNNPDATVLYNFCALSAETLCDEGTEADYMRDYYWAVANPSDGRCSMFEEWYGSMCEGGGYYDEWGGGEGGGYYDEWGNWVEEGGGEWGGGEGGEWGGGEGGEGDCGWCEVNWEFQENYLEPDSDIVTANLYGWDGTDMDRGICPGGWAIPSSNDYITLFETYANYEYNLLNALEYTSPQNGDNTFWTSDIKVYSLPWSGTFSNGYAPPTPSPESLVYYYNYSPLTNEAIAVDIASGITMEADRSELHRVRCMRW